MATALAWINEDSCFMILKRSISGIVSMVVLKFRWLYRFFAILYLIVLKTSVTGRYTGR